MSFVHQTMAAGGWKRFSLAEQLGNVGSEVERAIRARAAGDKGRFESAFERALELLALTIADDRWAGPRRREICRTREVVCDALHGDNEYHSSDESLAKYFLEFAITARMNR